ncbi:MAG: ribonuclease E/G [Candidatus Kariarchaeaceae archaeon]|jgi:hypothetical protein
MNNELKIRVESIYDLALAKLLLDHLEGMVLVSPTVDQKNYLQVPVSNDPHEVHIGDLEYRTGIQVKGAGDVVTTIETLLRENLPDAIVFNHPLQQDAVFNATVIKYIYRKRMAILDLGSGIRGIMFNVETNVGNTHLVQIKELTAEKDKLPVCSDIITLSGDYVILEVNADFVRVSRKIKGDDRTRLHELGKKLLPPGFGIIVRTSANAVSDQEIQEEIEKLQDMWRDIEKQTASSDENTKVVSGEKVSEIILGNASKVFLDKIRSALTTTLPNYHHFKAYSMASGLTADFAQQFVDRIAHTELANVLEDMVIERDYPVSNHVKAQFNFIDGTSEETIIGNIVKTGKTVVTRTTLGRDHGETSPNFTVSENDVMETYFSYGSWTVHYRYYSGDSNDLIGEKLRIITPLDFVYRGRIRAFDMGMTLYKNDDGDTTSKVNNATSNMVERGMISGNLDNKLGEVLRVAMQMLKTSTDAILIHLSQ